MHAADTLARLNYFNGLRLEADDLRTEQRFHIEIRRRLTAALFTPGIAAGLEVEPAPLSDHSVRILPGVAIDAEGREIILTHEVVKPVVGIPSPVEGVTLGNYVAIAYGEERTGPTDLSVCSPDTNFLPRRSVPSRLVHAPQIVFLGGWPGPETGYVVLARIALGDDCRVTDILGDVRRYVSAAQPPTTIPVSLEGEKDIDAANPKVLRFHIEGGTPQRAVLYLRGEQFSSLYYSELGLHSHVIDRQTTEFTRDLTHTHTASEGTTDQAGEHTHNYLVDGGERTGGIDVNNEQVVNRTNTDASAILPAGNHNHVVSGLELDEALGPMTHRHQVTGDVQTAGADGDTARMGLRLTHLSDLRVLYDSADITPQILAQLGAGWTSLGDGTGGHPLVTDGTGALDLVQLGVPLTIGAHAIEFRISGPDAGGQIQYNLYLS